MTISIDKYRLIIFDLDGTLYPLTRRLKFFFAIKNLPFLSLFRAHLRNIHTLRKSDFENRENLFNAHFETIATETNKDSSHIRKWYFNHFYPAFIASIRNHAKPRPQLNELLETLRNRGVTLVLFSDYSHIRERLTALGVDNTLFDLLVSGEDEGALKPNPRPIETITKKYNISKSNILIIGDRMESDGEVAKKSGIDSIIITEKLNNTKTQSWSAITSMILSEEEKR